MTSSLVLLLVALLAVAMTLAGRRRRAVTLAAGAALLLLLVRLPSRSALAKTAPASTAPTSTAHAHADANPDADAESPFRAWFESQIAKPTDLPLPVQKAAPRYRYVFVAGFLNETVRASYFCDNRQALLDLGVPAEAIHLIFPRSADTVETSATDLARQILELADKGPERLVIVGHSKGAVETLLFVQQNADFVRERVKAVFLVQGAIGGSGAADFVLGQGHPLDEHLPRAVRIELGLAVRAGGHLLDRHLHGGFISLTHQHAASLWKGKRIAGPVYFIRSQRAPNEVSKVLSLTARYLDAYYGANDGMVEVKDQWLAGAGTLLGTLQVDHAALTIASPVSNQSTNTRRAFTYALLMQVTGSLAPQVKP